MVLAGDEARILGEKGVGFFFRFPEEFEAEGLKAEFLHAREILGGALGLGVEDGVAAADVGDEGVRLADAVAEVELMAIAGAAAGAVVFSVRERVGEDAVLHVEHGHVLVDDGFEEARIDAG